MKKLAQGVNTAAQDSNPGPLSRESDAIPLSHGAQRKWHFPSAKSTRLIACFGFTEDYSRGKRFDESRTGDGR